MVLLDGDQGFGREKPREGWEPRRCVGSGVSGLSLVGSKKANLKERVGFRQVKDTGGVACSGESISGGYGRGGTRETLLPTFMSESLRRGQDKMR